MTSRLVTLASNVDIDGWRAAARRLIAAGTAPQDVYWRILGENAELFDRAATGSDASDAAQFSVPRNFVELAKTAILHRDPERFSLLYRLLWRLRNEPALIQIASDPDVAHLEKMAKSVRRDEHKMHAFVRFREVYADAVTRFVAWFEPEHHIVEHSAEFFVKRFASMRWSILTPIRCVHWDGQRLTFTDGAKRAEAATEDPLEETWRRYYANIFNPARLKPDMMRSEMPQKYWRNLPEASLIKPLIASARTRAAQMIEASPVPPPVRLHRLVSVAASSTLRHFDEANLAAMREAALRCRACPLWKPATQTVFGEGSSSAPLVFVGEQPGDYEDIRGRPFIGPAGQLFHRALVDAGIQRSAVYVTNAVKHFKFTPRGKRRIHQRPYIGEITACRPWLIDELDLIRPKLIVALGSTALRALLGKATTVSAYRGRFVAFNDHTRLLATVHPSYFLRLPDKAKSEAEYQLFVSDLAAARHEIGLALQ